MKAEVEQLQVQVQEPREIIFADVLLRRPKYVICFGSCFLNPPCCVLEEALCSQGRQPGGEGRTPDGVQGDLGLALALLLTMWQT